MTIAWDGNVEFGQLAVKPEDMLHYLDAFADAAGRDASEAAHPVLAQLSEARLLTIPVESVSDLNPREAMEFLWSARSWGDALGVFEYRPQEPLPPLSPAGQWVLRNPDELKKFYLMQLSKFQIPHGITGDAATVQRLTHSGVLLKPFLFILELIKILESVDRYDKYLSGAELESWVFNSHNQAQVHETAAHILNARRSGKEPPTPAGQLVQAFQPFLALASFTELLEVRTSWLTHTGGGFRVKEGLFVTSLSGRAEDSHRAQMIDYLLQQYGPRYFVFSTARPIEEQMQEWAEYYTAFDFGFEKRYSTRRKVQLIALESPDALEPPFYMAPSELTGKIRRDGLVKFVPEEWSGELPEKFRWIYRVADIGSHADNGRARVRLRKYRRLADAARGNYWEN